MGFVGCRKSNGIAVKPSLRLNILQERLGRIKGSLARRSPGHSVAPLTRPARSRWPSSYEATRKSERISVACFSQRSAKDPRVLALRQIGIFRDEAFECGPKRRVDSVWSPISE